MYHVSRFWPFVTILYITKMHPTSENCFFFVFTFLNSFWSKKKFVGIWLRKLHFSIWKCDLQCKNWYETYIFYFTIVFVTPNSPQKISLRVSIATKKIYQTFSFDIRIIISKRIISFWHIWDILSNKIILSPDLLIN